MGSRWMQGVRNQINCRSMGDACVQHWLSYIWYNDDEEELNKNPQEVHKLKTLQLI